MCAAWYPILRKSSKYTGREYEQQRMGRPVRRYAARDRHSSAEPSAHGGGDLRSVFSFARHGIAPSFGAQGMRLAQMRTPRPNAHLFSQPACVPCAAKGTHAAFQLNRLPVRAGYIRKKSGLSRFFYFSAKNFLKSLHRRPEIWYDRR